MQLSWVSLAMDLENAELLDFAFYRRRELLLLLKESNEGASGATARSRLLLLPTLDLPAGVTIRPSSGSQTGGVRSTTARECSLLCVMYSADIGYEY
jgi:hypothetical protein